MTQGLTVFVRFWPFWAEAIRRKIAPLQHLIRAAVSALAKNGENGRKRTRLVALGQSQDALGDVAEDQLLADRRDARDHDLAQEAFHVKLLGVAVAAMRQDRALAGVVGVASAEILGGIRLGAALVPVVVQPRRLEGQQVGG